MANGDQDTVKLLFVRLGDQEGKPPAQQGAGEIAAEAAKPQVIGPAGALQALQVPGGGFDVRYGLIHQAGEEQGISRPPGETG